MTQSLPPLGAGGGWGQGSDYDGDMLGAEQWAWLDDQLTQSSARVHLLVSSVQVRCRSFSGLHPGLCPACPQAFSPGCPRSLSGLTPVWPRRIPRSVPGQVRPTQGSSQGYLIACERVAAGRLCVFV